MGRMPVPDRRSFTPGRMPSLGTMGGYPAFPPAISLSGVGCIRVTHPCATLGPRGGLPFDLHVLGLPLAFILSQDQTLHCIIAVLNVFLNLGFRCVPCLPGATRLAAARQECCFLFSLLASDFQRTQNLQPHGVSLSRFAGAKVQHSPLTTSTFFVFFSSRGTYR